MLLQKYWKMQYIFAYNGLLWGHRLVLYILDSPRRAYIELWLTSNAATHRFREIRGQMANIGVWEAKMVHPNDNDNDAV